MYERGERTGERQRESEREERRIRGAIANELLLASTLPITVSLNDTNPGGSVDTEDASFFISIEKLAEFSGNDEIAGRSIFLPPVKFQKTPVFTGNNNTVTNYSATLSNGAFVSIIVS